MFSDSTSRISRPEVICKKGVLKNFKIFTRKHRYFSVNIAKKLFIDLLWWLLLNFFTESQEETVFSINGSFRSSFLIDFSFNILLRCTKRLKQPETIYFIVDFLFVIIYRYFLFVYMQKIYLLLLLIPFRFYSLSLFLLFYTPSAWILNLISVCLIFLILFGIKGVHFTLYGESYIQTDGLDMGFVLRPVLCRIFMVELENTLVQTLSNYLKSWKRYVDNTNCFIKENSIEHIM